MVRALREQDVVMSTPTSATPRPRLLAIHAAWLFDGVGSELIADPLVVLDGATIVGSSGMNVGDWGGLAMVSPCGATVLGWTGRAAICTRSSHPPSNVARAAMTKRSAFGALPS